MLYEVITVPEPEVGKAAAEECLDGCAHLVPRVADQNEGDIPEDELFLPGKALAESGIVDIGHRQRQHDPVDIRIEQRSQIPWVPQPQGDFPMPGRWRRTLGEKRGQSGLLVVVAQGASFGTQHLGKLLVEFAPDLLEAAGRNHHRGQLRGRQGLV